MRLKVLLFFTMIFCFVGAIGCLSWAFRIYQEMNWPSAQAVVVNSKLEDRYDDFKIVYIEYAFEVDGKKYLRWEDLGSFHPPKLGKVQDQYAKGKSIEVAYDPNKPAHSMLRGESNSLILIIVLAIPALLVSAGFFIISKLRKEKD